MQVLLAVAAGGALGALARFGLSGWIYRLAGGGFPWGTLVVNVTGSLFLGAVIRLLEAQPAVSTWRAFAVVGVAGAFTTFSTFSYEAVLLVQAREYGRAGLYAGGSVVLSVLAVVAGFALVSAVGGRG